MKNDRYTLVAFNRVDKGMTWFVRDTFKSTEHTEHGFNVPDKESGEKLLEFLNQQNRQLERTQKINIQLNKELHTIYRVLDEHIIYYEQGPVMWMQYAEDGLKEFKKHIQEELKCPTEVKADTV